jgi:hypothetical protein
MALIVADRVQETSTTTGTGSFTLAGAVTGYQTFASVLATADTTYYTIADQGGANWEVGLGTFTSPSTLARTTILSSSNAGSAVNFTAGTKAVFITYPAGRSVLSNSSGVVPVNVGGTGAATLTANNVILGNGTSAVQFVAPGTNGNVLTSNGTTWASTTPAAGPATYVRTAFTATAGQTTFTVAYTVGAVQVFVNGILLNSADYTASNGTSVVLASACLVGDIVEFIAISNGSLSLSAVTVGSTVISGGTSGRILYDNAGLVGETATVSVSQGGTGASTLTGVLKGNGTSAITAATAGTDFVAPGTATTFTAAQTFNGSSSVLGAIFANITEPSTISATAATGTIAYDVTTQSVLYYTSNASANWTVNFRASSGTSLNTAMATGQSITVAFLVTQGTTAYYNSAVQVDGTSVTPKYQGGSAWTAGNASSIDIYTYTIVKTGSAAFTVFTTQTQFK